MSGKTLLFEFRDSHSDLGLEVLRIFLGIALFARGVLFVLGGSAAVLDLVRAGGMDYFLPALALQAVTGLHLIGGLMLALGLLTRVAALIQIPVLLGAVYVASLQGGLLTVEQSLELSVLVLFLLCIFFVYGSGPVSLDRYFARHEEAPIELPPSRPFEWEDRYPEEQQPLASRDARPSLEEDAGGPEGSTGVYALALARYGIVSVVALVLVVIGVRNLPAAISVGEVGAVGVLVLVILGAFLLVYHTAFRED
jgi:uncharacterized membrane protein YphA (DoxX/SURF4 family)